MTCLSVGKKTDLLTPVVCLSEYYCWVLDVGVCRARLFIRRFGLLPQKQLFFKTQLVIVICLPETLLLFFSNPYIRGPCTCLCYQEQYCPFMHCCAPLCLFSNVGVWMWTSWNNYMKCVIITHGL